MYTFRRGDASMIKSLALTLLPLFFASGAAAGDYTPRTYVKAVLSASPALKRAEQSFARAEASYRSSLLDAALPSFTFSMSDSFYDQDRHYLHFDKGDASSSLSASLNLYDSASSPLSRIKTARLDYESARLTLLTARQTEALKALRRFYDLYSAQRKTEISRDNLASRERQYKDTNEQFESGTRSRTDVTQSEGDKLQSELSLAQAEAAGSKALMAFNELINAEPEEAQQVRVSSGGVEVKLPLPREDVARALENNYSLRLRRASLERERITVRNSIRGDLPRLRVDAAWNKSDTGVLGTRGGAWTDGQAYGVGASLNFPFGFLGAQNWLDAKGQRASLKAAELELEDAVRALKTDVLTSQKDIELQVKSKQLLEFQVKAQKEATDNLLEEYSLGGASSLQLDSAQTKLLDASNSRISAENDLDLALAAYRALLGEEFWE
jgi:outer membrane protein TolC